jgi:hypothetical protein
LNYIITNNFRGIGCAFDVVGKILMRRINLISSGLRMWEILKFE